jgi:glycyl-tRNA synthetase beta chain
LNRIWWQLHEAKPDFPAPSEDPSSSPLLDEIMDFVVERLRNLMVSDGFPQDVVDAVISANCNDLVETKRKIEALTEFRQAPDFEPLAIAFKRVVNIVKAQPRGTVDTGLLIESAERKLYQDYSNVREEVKKSISEKNYRMALSLMKNLKEPIDNYFDQVLVMDKDERIRQNRLSTLWEIRDLFFTVADFSKIGT